MGIFFIKETICSILPKSTHMPMDYSGYYGRARNGVRVHPNTLRSMWAKEFSGSGKCNFHTCLVFNKQAYYYLGNEKSEDSLKGLITKTWYSALGLELDDYAALVHFSENGKYILDKHSPDHLCNYGMQFVHLDYLTKLDSKIYEKGERNFGCSRK